jgi:hypothetical protein
MVTTKAVANAIHSAKSTDRRDNIVNRMNGAKPATRFMLAPKQEKGARFFPRPLV